MAKIAVFGQIRLLFDPGEPPTGEIRLINYLKLIASVFTVSIKSINIVLKSVRDQKRVILAKTAIFWSD